MTNLDDITAIRTHFLEAWGDATPVIVRGVDDDADQPETAYLILSVQPVREDRLTIGGAPEYETKGMVWIAVCSPRDEKDGRAWTLADQVASIFRNWRSDDGRIRCENINMREGEGEERFLRIIVTVDYRALHTY